MKPHEIWALEVQGRYGNGTGREFAEALMVDFLAPAQSTWTRYSTSSGNGSAEEQQILAANEDVQTAELVPMVPPVIATTIRLVPYSRQLRTVCLRFELYGCPVGNEWDDGRGMLQNEDDGQSFQQWALRIRNTPGRQCRIFVVSKIK